MHSTLKVLFPKKWWDSSRKATNMMLRRLICVHRESETAGVNCNWYVNSIWQLWTHPQYVVTFGAATGYFDAVGRSHIFSRGQLFRSFRMYNRYALINLSLLTEHSKRLCTSKITWQIRKMWLEFSSQGKTRCKTKDDSPRNEHVAPPPQWHLRGQNEPFAFTSRFWNMYIHFSGKYTLLNT